MPSTPTAASSERTTDTFDIEHTAAPLLPPPSCNAPLTHRVDFLQQQLDSIGTDTPILDGLVLLGSGYNERLQGGVAPKASMSHAAEYRPLLNLNVRCSRMWAAVESKYVSCTSQASSVFISDTNVCRVAIVVHYWCQICRATMEHRGSGQVSVLVMMQGRPSFRWLAAPSMDWTTLSSSLCLAPLSMLSSRCMGRAWVLLQAALHSSFPRHVSNDC